MQELNIAREQYKKEFGVAFDDKDSLGYECLEKMAMENETDWALCEKCKARVEAKL